MKRLKEQVQSELNKKILNELKYKNIFQIPKLEKISINIGIGKYKDDMPRITRIANDLYKITGQKPKLCKSKKAISGFKLREGDIIGLNLNLRGKRMYEFLEKLLYITIPRVRDFRGLKTTSIDQNNNLTIGIRENIIFPEIAYERIEDIYGLQITFVTTAKNNKEALILFKTLGFPFAKMEDK